MKHLRLFETEAEYTAAESALDTPNVSLVDENGGLHFKPMEPVSTDAVYLYKTDIENFPDAVDDQDYFEYAGIYELDGLTLYKWRKHEVSGWSESNECYILTDTRNFEGVSTDNPYLILGLVLNDEYDDEYDDGYANDRIVYASTTNDIIYPEYHDTSVLDSNDLDYVDLGLPSGTLWAAMNVGASTAEGYGNFYMWGSTADNSNSDCSWSNAPFNGGNSSYNESAWNAAKDSAVDENNILLPANDVAHTAWGGDWKMPTQKHLSELYFATTHQWVTDYNGSGHNGILFTSKVNSNTLFIPAAGCRYDSSSGGQGSDGCVWSSSLNTSRPDCAFYSFYLYFGNDYVSMSNDYRCDGHSVRPVLY